MLYDERLDWLRNRSFAGGAKWLLRDPGFQKWLDNSNRDTVWLWLQGIPGSGKTFLAAAAIEASKKLHRTLFVFASYANQNSITALAVIQSLIFQVAIEDKDFQAALVESNERELSGNTAYALELLKTQLNSDASVVIAIDGLDEIETYERQILLQRLEELSEACSKLKILICSRAEDDISKALDKKATTIRVDQKNSGSIQGYINKRSQEWIEDRGLDTGAISEVLGLLSPLSAKANGKF
jgi:Cdc6-like AAA superfamily ATPase